jgi:tetratricopeptide (TPR) repeat protein
VAIRRLVLVPWGPDSCHRLYSFRRLHRSGSVRLPSTLRWTTSAILAIACACLTWTGLPRWRDSLNLFDAALKVGPHYVAFNNRGIAHLQAGQVDEAFADYGSAISVNPSFNRAYNNRGSLLSDLGRYDEAIRDFDKAIQCDPFFSEAYDNRGNALARKGQPELALHDYNKCVALNPNRAVSYNNRAAAYFQLKRFSEASADVKTCEMLGGHPHPGLVQALTEAIGANGKML